MVKCELLHEDGEVSFLGIFRISLVCNAKAAKQQILRHIPSNEKNPSVPKVVSSVQFFYSPQSNLTSFPSRYLGLLPQGDILAKKKLGRGSKRPRMNWGMGEDVLIEVSENNIII